MIPYWLDECPVCGKKATMACRCFRNERRCPNGHWWRRDEYDVATVVPGPHMIGNRMAETVNVPETTPL